MNLPEAQEKAARVQAALFPYCERISVAGSIRREKERIGDIEIVCIPKVEPTDLFGGTLEASHGFCEAVAQWPAVKGKATGKYTQRTLACGTKLDIFIVTPNTWGLALAVRTGSAAFSHYVLACKWVALGYKSEEFVLWRHGKAHYIREEHELFELLGLKWVEPRQRQ